MFDYFIYQLFTLGVFVLGVHFHLKAFLKLKFIHQALIVVIAVSAIGLYPKFKIYQKEQRKKNTEESVVGEYILKTDGVKLKINQDKTWSISGLDYKCKSGTWSVMSDHDAYTYLYFVGRCGANSSVFNGYIYPNKSIEVPKRSMFEIPSDMIVLRKIEN